MASTDPLEGYRGVERSPDERIEDEVRIIHRLNEDGIDIELVREVVKADQLIEAMKGDKVLARLVTHVTTKMDEASKQWSACSDPRSDQAVRLHAEARAARMVIDWIQYVLETGAQAQKQMEAEINEY